jgi:hypothetical protein
MGRTSPGNEPRGRSWPPRGESATVRVRNDRGYPCPALGRESKPFNSPPYLGFGTCRFSGATHDGPLPIISAPDASERGSGQGHDITPKRRLGRTMPAQTPLPEAREGSRAPSWALEAQRPSRRPFIDPKQPKRGRRLVLPSRSHRGFRSRNRVKGAGRAASRGRVLCRDDAMAWIRRREPRGSRPVHLRRVAPNRRIPGRRYEALARPRRWREALPRSSSSAARSAIRSSSVISRHTVDRRDPDRRTCPAASSSPSSFRVGS